MRLLLDQLLVQLLCLCEIKWPALRLGGASPWPLLGAMGLGQLDGIGVVGGSLCVFL